MKAELKKQLKEDLLSFFSLVNIVVSLVSVFMVAFLINKKIDLLLTALYYVVIFICGLGIRVVVILLILKIFRKKQK